MTLIELKAKIDKITTTLNSLKEEVSSVQIILNELYLEELRLEAEECQSIYTHTKE